MDIKDAGVGVRDARYELLKFYDQLPGAEEFESVDKGDFWERHDKFRNSRTKKKGEDKLAFQKKFHSMGAPSVKRAFLA